MKKFIVAVMAMVLLACAMSAMASYNETRDFTITPSISYNYLVSENARDTFGNPFGVACDFEWSSIPVGIEVEYIWNKKNDIRNEFVPVFATYSDNLSESTYWTLATGAVFTKFDNDRKTCWGGEIGVGTYLNPDFNIQLDYFYYGKVEDINVHGVSLSLGYTF